MLDAPKTTRTPSSPIRSQPRSGIIALLAGAVLLGAAPDLSAAPPGPGRLARISAHRRPLERPPTGWSKLATATRLLAPVYDTLDRPRYVVGSVQRGTVVAARPVPSAGPCHDRGQAGAWFEIPGGYVCSASGYAIANRAFELSPPQRLPDLSRAVPFSFVKVTTPNSIRYEAPVPSKANIEEYQTKAYFLAVSNVLRRGGTEWTRTVYDEFVRAEEVRPIEPTRLVGEKLGADRRLPLGFVFGAPEGVEVFCEDGSPCGRVEQYHRFPVEGPPRGGRLPVRHDGEHRWIPEERVRVIRRIDRPRRIPASAKWVHVDLAHQAFVAYEGDAPVYASLVSTGIPSHATPNGLHRVYRKYVTKTMRGPDPDAGRYRVEEIPWVMYYRGNYALHGAYWHDEFGNVRSHGCTNIAPQDAKWLYHWGTGEMPPGWHANYRVDEGTWVYLTGSLRGG